MMGLRGESMNPMTFGNMIHPKLSIRKGVQYWALDVYSVRKQEFLMEKIS